MYPVRIRDAFASRVPFRTLTDTVHQLRHASSRGHLQRCTREHASLAPARERPVDRGTMVQSPESEVAQRRI